MDIMCRICGEPTDIDYLHDVAAEQGSTFNQVRKGFSAKGCEALGESHNTTSASPAIGLLTDLLGDDIDGLAAELEDAEMLGLL